jgi:RHS repeat-associated protein
MPTGYQIKNQCATPGLPQVMEYQHYYPFGMQLEALGYTSGNDLKNNYLYNGKELQEDYGLNWYDYGARFYDPVIGRFTTQDAYAEKYASLTPYQYGANNPLRFIDVNGDSISATQNFINNEKTVSAMKAILSSKAGYAYFAKYAAKGDNLLGFKFKADGEFSKNGIDLSLDVGRLDIANGNTKMEKSKDDAGFDITIKIDTRGIESKFDVAETIIHEGFLEANYMAKDIMDNGKKDYSNISNWVKNNWLKGDVSNYGHGQNYVDRRKNGGENLLWPGTGYRVLQDVNKSLNSRLTNQRIQDKMSGFWGVYGQLFGKSK